jgi:hypothetical protein
MIPWLVVSAASSDVGSFPMDAAAAVPTFIPNVEGSTGGGNCATKHYVFYMLRSPQCSPSLRRRELLHELPGGG